MSFISDYRTSLKTDATDLSAGGYTLPATRIKLGYLPRTSAEDFLGDVQADGPFLLIGPGGREGLSIQSPHARYSIACKLWIGIPRDTADELKNIDDFLSALKAAWAGATVSWEIPKFYHKQRPAVLLYRITADTVGC